MFAVSDAQKQCRERERDVRVSPLLTIKCPLCGPVSFSIFVHYLLPIAHGAQPHCPTVCVSVCVRNVAIKSALPLQSGSRPTMRQCSRFSSDDGIGHQHSKRFLRVSRFAQYKAGKLHTHAHRHTLTHVCLSGAGPALFKAHHSDKHTFASASCQYLIAMAPCDAVRAKASSRDGRRVFV